MTEIAPISTQSRSSLAASSQSQSQPKKRRRIGEACIACRRRKSRCNGARPVCSACSELDISCQYASRSDRENRQKDRYLNALENRLATLESKFLEPSPAPTSSPIDITRSIHSLPADTGRKESSHSAENTILQLRAGPAVTLGPRSLIQEPESFFEDGDLDQGNLGYFGPSSLIAYAYTVSRALKAIVKPSQEQQDGYSDLASQAADSGGLAALRPGGQPSTLSFQTSPGSGRSQGHAEVDVTSLPDHTTTLRLVESYFDHVGILMPFLHRETFLAIYTQFRSGQLKIRRTWLALLNLVIATALQRTSGPGRSADQCYEDTVPFYERAVLLGDGEMHRDPNLEMVQYLVLLTQYLQGTRKAGLTWSTHGRAVQAALQIGLHCQRTNFGYAPLEREIRRRTWSACFILDRTLSMAFGRPPAIHDSFMRPSSPVSFADLASVPHDRTSLMGQSAEYYASTTSLFSVVGSAVELLYGNNLGFEEDNQLIFSVMSDVLHVEQLFHKWVASLPVWLHPDTPQALDDLDDVLPPTLARRFHTITLVRYHYARALIHRPVVIRLLAAPAESQHYGPQTANGGLGVRQLQDVGQRSLDACTQSSTSLISCIHAVCTAQKQKFLLGTWWCTLYFTFTAALNLFSACLILLNERNMKMADGSSSVADPKHASRLRQKFRQAITVLEILDGDNTTVWKCVSCLKNLDVALARLNFPDSVTDPQTMIANDLSTPGQGSAYTSSAFSMLPPLDDSDGTDGPHLSYADFEQAFDQDLTFLNDMVF